MPLQIFLSYSHSDSDFATKLTEELEHEGYDIWLDRTDIQIGSHWDDEIVQGLNTSQVFMVILSNTSVASQNVKDEIGYAIDHHKHIVPLLLESCEIPFRLRRIQYVDFTKFHFKDGFKSLLEILRSVFPEIKLHPKKKERKPVDPATLAATVTGLITPFLVKMGESAVEEVGAKLPEKLSQLWLTISNRFKGNPTASAVTSDLARNAQDTDNQEAFALQLKKILKEDPDFAGTLSDLLEEAQGNVSNVGNGNIAVGKIHIGGNVSGNLTIGNKNQIGDQTQNIDGGSDG